MLAQQGQQRPICLQTAQFQWISRRKRTNRLQVRDAGTAAGANAIAFAHALPLRLVVHGHEATGVELLDSKWTALKSRIVKHLHLWQHQTRSRL